MLSPYIGGRYTLPPWRWNVDTDELVFQYCPEQSYERNFTRWFMMNCEERAEFGERAYSQKEGLKVFRRFIGEEFVN